MPLLGRRIVLMRLSYYNKSLRVNHTEKLSTGSAEDQQ